MSEAVTSEFPKARQGRGRASEARRLSRLAKAGRATLEGSMVKANWRLKCKKQIETSVRDERILVLLAGGIAPREIVKLLRLSSRWVVYDARARAKAAGLQGGGKASPKH